MSVNDNDSGIRVLFVEDDVLTQHLIADMLQGKVGELRIAENGEQGLRLYEKVRPDLVITDIMMPVMNGLDMARGIRRIDPAARIAFMTAYTDSAYFMGAIELGIDYYILKPVDIRRLFEVLGQCQGRIETTKKLKEQNERYQALAEMTYSIPWEFDISADRWTYVAPQAGKILGYSPVEWKDLAWWVERLHEDDREWAPRFCSSATARGENHEFDYRFIARDGRIVWLHDVVTVEMRENHPSIMRGVMIDITSLKNTEAELSQSRELLQRSVDGMLDGYALHEAIFDDKGVMRDYRFLEFNQVAQRISNISRDEIVGRTALDLYPHIVERGLMKRYADVMATGNPAYIEDFYYEGDSLNKAFDISCFRLDPIHFVCVFRDITERKKMTDELLKSEEEYRSVLVNMQDIFIRSDADGKLVMISPSGAIALGYDSIYEMLGMDMAEQIFAFPEDRARFLRTMRSRGRLENYEVSFRHRNGSEVMLSMNAHFLYDGEGNITGAEAICRDVTEVKKLEEQLRQSQKMEAIGLLAGGVAHDFNNMLQAITTYGHLLQKKIRDKEPLSGYVEEILKTSWRAAELTKGLLAYSRKQTLKMKPEGLNEIVREVERLIRRVIGEDIGMLTEFSSSDPAVMVDAGQIKQVLINLATNARDAMPAGGKLTIATAAVDLSGDFQEPEKNILPGCYGLLTVSDTGRGMDEYTQIRIFEPFFTTKEVGKGTGLGLAIVYGIVKQHNGYIFCESGEGQGSVFQIYLPFASVENIEEIVSEVPVVPRGKETILFAEDDETVRSVVRIVLEEKGYKVIEAVDGEDATEKFSEHRNEIHLLLTDMIMPKKNGMTAYQEIKQISPGVRVCFISGYSADMAKARGIEDEGFHLISKPIDPDSLLRKIREVLDE